PTPPGRSTKPGCSPPCWTPPSALTPPAPGYNGPGATTPGGSTKPGGSTPSVKSPAAFTPTAPGYNGPGSTTPGGGGKPGGLPGGATPGGATPGGVGGGVGGGGPKAPAAFTPSAPGYNGPGATTPGGQAGVLPPGTQNGAGGAAGGPRGGTPGTSPGMAPPMAPGGAPGGAGAGGGERGGNKFGGSVPGANKGAFDAPKPPTPDSTITRAPGSSSSTPPPAPKPSIPAAFTPTAPGYNGPGAVPGSTGGTTPGSTPGSTPGTTLPGTTPGSTPGGATPGGATPGGVTPGGATPGGSAPKGSVPGMPAVPGTPGSPSAPGAQTPGPQASAVSAPPQGGPRGGATPGPITSPAGGANPGGMAPPMAPGAPGAGATGGERGGNKFGGSVTGANKGAFDAPKPPTPDNTITRAPGTSSSTPPPAPKPTPLSPPPSTTSPNASTAPPAQTRPAPAAPPVTTPAPNTPPAQTPPAQTPPAQSRPAPAAPPANAPAPAPNTNTPPPAQTRPAPAAPPAPAPAPAPAPNTPPPASSRPAPPPVSAPPVNTPPANTPAANTPPANTPPANAPAANTPPANTPPANTPPPKADTAPAPQPKADTPPPAQTRPAPAAPPVNTPNPAPATTPTPAPAPAPAPNVPPPAPAPDTRSAPKPDTATSPQPKADTPPPAETRPAPPRPVPGGWAPSTGVDHKSPAPAPVTDHTNANAMWPPAGPRPGSVPNVPGVVGPPQGIFAPNPPAADSLRPIADAAPPKESHTTPPAAPDGPKFGPENKPFEPPKPGPSPDPFPVKPIKASPNLLDLLDPRGYPDPANHGKPGGHKADAAWPATTIDGKPWADLQNLTPDESRKWIDHLRNVLASKPDGAFFWSGNYYDSDGNRISVMNEAEYMAKADGRNTLEGTLDDKAIKLPGWGNTSPEGKAVWDSVSASLAHGASGDVYVLLGPSRRPDNVFHMTEFPILQQNPNVERVITVDVHTKEETVIYTKTPPADAPPANTPPANTPPANTPPANTPPANTPPPSTPPANTPPPGQETAPPAPGNTDTRSAPPAPGNTDTRSAPPAPGNTAATPNADANAKPDADSRPRSGPETTPGVDTRPNTDTNTSADNNRSTRTDVPAQNDGPAPVRDTPATPPPASAPPASAPPASAPPAPPAQNTAPAPARDVPATPPPATPAPQAGAHAAPPAQNQNTGPAPARDVLVAPVPPPAPPAPAPAARESNRNPDGTRKDVPKVGAPPAATPPTPESHQGKDVRTDESWRHDPAKTADWSNPNNPADRSTWADRRNDTDVRTVDVTVHDVRTDSTPTNVKSYQGLINYDLRRIETSPGRFVQEYTVKVHLDPAANVDADALAQVRQNATDGVNSLLNQGFRLPSGDQFHLNLEFTDNAADAHTTVKVDKDVANPDQTHWNPATGPEVLAHETLHYLGVPDEYSDSSRVFQQHDTNSGVHQDDGGLMGADVHLPDPGVRPRHLWLVERTATSQVMVPDTTLEKPGPATVPPPAGWTPPAEVRQDGTATPDTTARQDTSTPDQDVQTRPVSRPQGQPADLDSAFADLGLGPVDFRHNQAFTNLAGGRIDLPTRDSHLAGLRQSVEEGRPPSFVVNMIVGHDQLGGINDVIDAVTRDAGDLGKNMVFVIGVNGRADASSAGMDANIDRANQDVANRQEPIALVPLPKFTEQNFPYGKMRNGTMHSGATKFAIGALNGRDTHPYLSIQDFDTGSRQVPSGKDVFNHLSDTLNSSEAGPVRPLMHAGGYRVGDPDALVADVEKRIAKAQAELDADPDVKPAARAERQRKLDLARDHLKPENREAFVRGFQQSMNDDMDARTRLADSAPMVPYFPEPNLFVDANATVVDPSVRFSDGLAEFNGLAQSMNRFAGAELVDIHTHALPKPDSTRALQDARAQLENDIAAQGGTPSPSQSKALESIDANIAANQDPVREWADNRDTVGSAVDVDMQTNRNPFRGENFTSDFVDGAVATDLSRIAFEWAKADGKTWAQSHVNPGTPESRTFGFDPAGDRPAVPPKAEVDLKAVREDFASKQHAQREAQQLVEHDYDVDPQTGRHTETTRTGGWTPSRSDALKLGYEDKNTLTPAVSTPAPGGGHMGVDPQHTTAAEPGPAYRRNKLVPRTEDQLGHIDPAAKQQKTATVLNVALSDNNSDVTRTFGTLRDGVLPQVGAPRDNGLFAAAHSALEKEARAAARQGTGGGRGRGRGGKAPAAAPVPTPSDLRRGTIGQGFDASPDITTQIANFRQEHRLENGHLVNAFVEPGPTQPTPLPASFQRQDGYDHPVDNTGTPGTEPTPQERAAQDRADAAEQHADNLKAAKAEELAVTLLATQLKRPVVVHTADGAMTVEPLHDRKPQVLDHSAPADKVAAADWTAPRFGPALHLDRAPNPNGRSTFQPHDPANPPWPVDGPSHRQAPPAPQPRGTDTPAWSEPQTRPAPPNGTAAIGETSQTQTATQAPPAAPAVVVESHLEALTADAMQHASPLAKAVEAELRDNPGRYLDHEAGLELLQASVVLDTRADDVAALIQRHGVDAVARAFNSAFSRPVFENAQIEAFGDLDTPERRAAFDGWAHRMWETIGNTPAYTGDPARLAGEIFNHEKGYNRGTNFAQDEALVDAIGAPPLADTIAATAVYGTDPYSQALWTHKVLSDARIVPHDAQVGPAAFTQAVTDNRAALETALGVGLDEAKIAELTAQLQEDGMVADDRGPAAEPEAQAEPAAQVDTGEVVAQEPARELTEAEFQLLALTDDAMEHATPQMKAVEAALRSDPARYVHHEAGLHLLRASVVLHTRSEDVAGLMFFYGIDGVTDAFNGLFERPVIETEQLEAFVQPGGNAKFESWSHQLWDTIGNTPSYADADKLAMDVFNHDKGYNRAFNMAQQTALTDAVGAPALGDAIAATPPVGGDVVSSAFWVQKVLGDAQVLPDTSVSAAEFTQAVGDHRAELGDALGVQLDDAAIAELKSVLQDNGMVADDVTPSAPPADADTGTAPADTDVDAETAPAEAGVHTDPAPAATDVDTETAPADADMDTDPAPVAADVSTETAPAGADTDVDSGTTQAASAGPRPVGSADSSVLWFDPRHETAADGGATSPAPPRSVEPPQATRPNQAAPNPAGPAPTAGGPAASDHVGTTQRQLRYLHEDVLARQPAPPVTANGLYAAVGQARNIDPAVLRQQVVGLAAGHRAVTKAVADWTVSRPMHQGHLNGALVENLNWHMQSDPNENAGAGSARDLVAHLIATQLSVNVRIHQPSGQPVLLRPMGPPFEETVDVDMVIDGRQVTYRPHRPLQQDVRMD
ncbi:hypothetical protein ACFWGZ_33295, partial [Lentzea sp. NPDC060358]